MASLFLVRPCFEQDLEVVRFIAAHHVSTGVAALEDQEPAPEALHAAWVETVIAERPFVVACPKADPSRIVGFGYVRPLLGAAIFAQAPEVRVAVSPGSLRAKVGSSLLNVMLRDLQAAGVRQVFAAYGREEPDISEPFYARAYFQPAGLLPKATHKWRRPIDVRLMTRAL